MDNEKNFDKLKDIERQKGYDAAIEQLRKMLNGEDSKDSNSNNGGQGGDSNNKQNGSGDSNDKSNQQTQNNSGNNKSGGGNGNSGGPKQQQPKLNPDDQKIADENAKKKSKGGKGKDGKDKDDSGEKNNDSNSGGSQAGTDQGDVESRALDDELRRMADETVEKYSKALSGAIGKFVGKATSSRRLERPDILANSSNGRNSWNQKLLLVCQSYIHSRLRNLKEYKNTYNRVRRGERAFTAADMQNGRPIIQGREELKKKIGFDIALYYDVSGSMSSCIDHVFEAGYSIVEKLKVQFGKDKHVDRSKIHLKSYVFTTIMKQIPFGKKCSANGGTYAFDDLLSDVQKRGDSAFLNIIITDGDFSNYSNDKAAKIMGDMEGMFVIVSNKTEGYFKELENAANKFAPGKFAAIYADGNFTVK